MKVPAVEARVEGRSTVEDRQPRNSCRQVCCVFVAQAASGCGWNETSAGDDQTENDSRQQDTREQHQRATDARTRDLERDSLTNWQPVQLPQHWCDVVAATGACDQASGSVLHRLKALKKSVTDTLNK